MKALWARLESPLSWTAIAALSLALYSRVLVALATSGQTDSAAAHIPLIALISLALLWQRRDRILSVPSAPNGWGIAVVGVALIARLAGIATDSQMLSVITIPLLIAGTILLLRGTNALREATFPIVFLLFMAKIPSAIVDSVSLPMQLLASRTAEGIGLILQIPVTRDGVILTLPRFELFVVEACSGLRMAMVLIAFAALITHLTPCRRVGKAILLSAALPLALIANALRVTAILLVGWYFGKEAAFGFLHAASGIFLFAAALGPLVLLGRYLARRDGIEVETSPPAPLRFGGGSRTGVFAMIALLIGANLLAGRLTAAPIAPRAIGLDDFPRHLNGWVGRDLAEIGDSLTLGLGAQGTLYRDYRRGREGIELLMVARSAGSRVYHHQPEVCLPANGYVILDRQPRTFAVFGQQVRGTSLLLEWRKQRFACLYWYASGRESTGDYTKIHFLMVRDRLLRRDTTWTLIRLMTPVGNSPHEADTRLLNFADEIVPMVPRI